MTPETDDVTLLLPLHAYRQLHSMYVDALLRAKAEGHTDLAHWLLGLTENQVTFERFAVAIAHRRVLKATYMIADDEDMAWAVLSGLHPTGDWLPLEMVDAEDLGIRLDWFRTAERIAVEDALTHLLGDDE